MTSTVEISTERNSTKKKKTKEKEISTVLTTLLNPTVR